MIWRHQPCGLSEELAIDPLELLLQSLELLRGTMGGVGGNSGLDAAVGQGDLRAEIRDFLQKPLLARDRLETAQ